MACSKFFFLNSLSKQIKLDIATNSNLSFLQFTKWPKELLVTSLNKCSNNWNIQPFRQWIMNSSILLLA